MDVQHRLAILLHLPRSFALPVPKDWSHLLVCFSPSPLFNFSWLLWLIFHCFVVQPLSGVQFFVTPWRYIYIYIYISTPGFPVLHYLPDFAQIHVLWVSDAIQPSHPLSSPSPPAFNLSQHQGHFKWVSSSHQVAKVLEFQLQHQSFQWIFRTDSL